jgi:FkbM family methyltransferase
MIEHINSICLHQILSNTIQLAGPPVTVKPANYIEHYRWATLLTKEPETIEWIKNIPADGGLLDIGANIGCYSLSALAKGLKCVLAIEPYTPNFSSLCRSITDNKLDGISAFCFGFSQKVNIVSFQGQSHLPGSAEFVAHDIESYSLANCLLLSPDTLPSFFFRGITHIKIDVDGSEFDVAQSLKSLLTSNDIQSVLIEVDHISTEKPVLNYMRTLGYDVDRYYEEFKPHSSDRRIAEPSNTTRNIVFSK